MIEVEKKVYLGTRPKAELFRQKLLKMGAIPAGQENQLNHYFVGGRPLLLACTPISPLASDPKYNCVANYITQAKISVRTRKINADPVLLVLKGSFVNPENGTARREVEVPLLYPSNGAPVMSMEDAARIVCGVACYTVQAKWSRQRETFQYGSITITLDKNAGYGYLAEFELMVTDAEAIAGAEKYLRLTLKDFKLKELAADRLARMFEFYNAHWKDYYGTDKVFEVE
jgi:adenylate cyclase class IV